MTYTITKEFTFSASHQLAGLPDEHPCSRLHGHNYVVVVELAAEQLNETGFVLDYRMLDPFKVLLDGMYDHRHLNDILPINPTAENLAMCFYEVLRGEENTPYPQVVAVRVSETPKTWAEYRP